MRAPNERAHARRVRDMFGSIAERYDFLNHFLSGNIDHRWRRSFVRKLEENFVDVTPRILDLGCGTADLSLALARFGSVVGCDFCHPMLIIGKQKAANIENLHRIDLLEGDASCLPFPDSSFDAVVSAFLVRNLPDIEKGLKEMHRVVRTGGVLGILDFAMPSYPLLGTIYRLYLTRVLPKLGRLLSGVNGPYQYLADSVQTFPPPDELERRIGNAGFTGTEFYLLTGGIAVFHTARKL